MGPDAKIYRVTIKHEQVSLAIKETIRDQSETSTYNMTPVEGEWPTLAGQSKLFKARIYRHENTEPDVNGKDSNAYRLENSKKDKTPGL